MVKTSNNGTPTELGTFLINGHFPTRRLFLVLSGQKSRLGALYSSLGSIWLDAVLIAQIMLGYPEAAISGF